jgi:transcriptional regulator with XRE-family HTH domain
MDRFELGARLKSLRLENDLTQEELAARTELSKGFISQLERGLTSPSINTLGDVLEVLGTQLSEFFSNDDEDVVVFTPQDFYVKTDEELKHTIHWIVPNAQKYEMEPIVIELEVGGHSPHDKPHAGEEFGYVLEGKVLLRYGKQRMIIEAGQTFYYPARKAHWLENIGASHARILWVSTPPMF